MHHFLDYPNPQALLQDETLNYHSSSLIVMLVGLHDTGESRAELGAICVLLPLICTACIVPDMCALYPLKSGLLGL